MNSIDFTRYAYSIYDSEPDLYYYNILGQSGSFTLDAYGDVIMMPENDFKILPAIGPKSINNYWTIIDKKGNRYKFGVNSNEGENVKITVTPEPEYNKTREYTASWYLSEIKTQKNRVFRFDYLQSSKTKYLSKSETKTGNNYIKTTVKTEILNPTILTKITNENGYIDFEVDDDRLDMLNAIRVRAIKLYNNNSDLIKTIEFNHSYFNSKENCNEPECKRLKLIDVSEIGILNNRMKKYNFEYNNLNLPRRGSPEIDHWGYYNNNGQTNLIPRSNPSNVHLYRRPDENSSKANILEKIIYPTGGYTKFIFGLNNYEESNLNVVTGGLRIQSIEKGGTITPIITSYSYNNENSSLSSGIQYNLPIYTQSRRSVVNINGFLTSYTYTQINSHTLNNILDLNGSNIGYKNVTTIHEDGRKEILKYTNLISNPNIYRESDYFIMNSHISGGNTFIESLNPFESPFGPPSSNMSSRRGLLKEKILKNNAGQKIYHLWNDYSSLAQKYRGFALGFKFDLNYDFIVDQGSYHETTYYSFYCSIYRVRDDNYRLRNSTEKYFYDTGDVIKTNSYIYSYYHPTLIREHQVTYNDGEARKTSYKYPESFKKEYTQIYINPFYPYNSTEIIRKNLYSDMVEKNMLNYPVEVTKSVNNKVISTELWCI